MKPPCQSGRVATLVMAALLASACSSERDTVLVVGVRIGTAQLSASVHAVRAIVEQDDRVAMHDFRNADGSPIAFPTSFSLELDRRIAGPIRLEVQGLGRSGAVRAVGGIDAIALRPGNTQRVDVLLTCLDGCPPGDDWQGVDGGVPPGEDGGLLCGNGVLDPGETCDTGIRRGRPGACPDPSCNDGIACTTDVRTGGGCTLVCEHIEIRTAVSGDACCPADATWQSDADCSRTCGNGVVEAGETCDSALPAGQPGACPLARECADAQACTVDALISANTCAARCVHQVIAKAVDGDGCCPAHAAPADDSDCVAVCGDGELEAGETCDTGIKAGLPGACPLECKDADGCTRDRVVGAGCQARCESVPITEIRDGDGCCHPGSNATLDADCKSTCGNLLVEPGEACDRGIPVGQPGACPVACAADGCRKGTLSGRADDCSARCEWLPISQCDASSGDGCCAEGCVSTTDVDCSATCGNGTREDGETCDTAAAPDSASACPSRCDDGKACTADRLEGKGTCQARCVYTPVTAFVAGDGCCPPGGHHGLDTDCPASCGNGIVERPAESCDVAIAAASPGACPLLCPQPRACERQTFAGEAAACTSACRLQTIEDCAAGDGCCPVGCSALDDGDCGPVCGNGVLEAGEACDRGITAGIEGACADSCNDGLSCTVDLTLGDVGNCSRTCVHRTITACAGGDGCCPEGCNPATDSDCAPLCGNGRIEDGETCDAPASCPTRCEDDRDACTRTQLEGDPARCTARCKHVPITDCSEVSDGCCPTGCAQKDPDCAGAAGGDKSLRR